MADNQLKDGFGREDEYREQLSHVEDTIAAITAKEKQQQQELEETRRQKRTFQEEQQRLKTQIGKELSDRYSAPEQQTKSQAKRGTVEKGAEQSGPVSKVQIEKMEKQISQPQAQLILSPPGMKNKAHGQRDQKISKMVAEMKEQLEQQQQQAKQAFDKNSKKGFEKGKGRGR